MSENATQTNEKANQQPFFKRRRGCPFAGEGAPKIDYKNPELLRNFTSEGGRILPRRITNVSSKKQRELRTAIKKARILALLPFVNSNFK